MNNTDEFKHFKLHNDSTLKLLKKEGLIKYIHMLYHNWKATDESYNNAMEYAKKLSDKEIPKKVLNAEAGSGYEHKCPTCGYCVGTIVVDDLGKHVDQDDYCSTCGQRLDWSGKDD